MIPIRRHLAACLVVVVVTAVFSSAYFHIDEYFQVLEWTWFKLGIDPAWTLPWEYGQRMRAFIQPFVYCAIAGPLPTRDIFVLGFVLRLFTGLASWTALTLFVRATLPLLGTPEEQRLQLRVATLAGFLPYLFVRTSSETFAMASFTAAFALVMQGAKREPRWTIEASFGRALGVGLLCGFAFESRFQSLALTLGLGAWLLFIAKARRVVAIGALGFAAMVGVGALVDRWGYGEWAFPPWNYYRANIIEGAAVGFGREPPFAYAWLSLSNIFFPLMLALLFFMLVAWVRQPRSPITWATLPFVVLHGLVVHKEERFLFPIAILATSFVVLAIGPSFRSGRRVDRIADWVWARRGGRVAKGLAGWSVVMMALLAFWPLGWHHHVRFQRYIHDAMGGELRAAGLPDLDLGTPAYHGPIYDVEKVSPEELGRRIDQGTAREWLIADAPRLHTGVASVDDHAKLVWSEVPFFEHPAVADRFVALADAYNAHARPPLRVIGFRSLYRLR